MSFFSNRCSSYSFSLILAQLGTHDPCANTHKTVEEIFEILILIFFCKILKFGLDL